MQRPCKRPLDQVRHRRQFTAEIKARTAPEEVTGIKGRVVICRERRPSPQGLARRSGGTSALRRRSHQACRWSRRMWRMRSSGFRALGCPVALAPSWHLLDRECWSKLAPDQVLFQTQASCDEKASRKPPEQGLVSRRRPYRDTTREIHEFGRSCSSSSPEVIGNAT